jgi:hypothetical protein
MVETMYDNMALNLKYMMDDIMDKIIDSHLQDEEISQDQLQLAYKELDPVQFITDDVTDILADMVSYSAQKLLGRKVQGADLDNITNKFIEVLTLEELVLLGLVSEERVLEVYNDLM